MNKRTRITDAFEVVPNRADMPENSVTINVSKFTAYTDMPYQTLNLTVEALERLLELAKAEK